MKKKTVSKKSTKSKPTKIIEISNPFPEKPDENIKTMLSFLSKSYEDMAKYVEGERNRNLNMQTYIGEAVTYELLCQSYGVPEYTPEEKLKRFLSCIMQAIDKYYEAKKDYPAFNSEAMANLWARRDDPHSLPGITPDIDTIKIREIPIERPQSHHHVVEIVPGNPSSTAVKKPSKSK
jgi:hypothetical protein